MDFLKLNGLACEFPPVSIGGIDVYKRFLSISGQKLLVEELRKVAVAAPVFLQKLKPVGQCQYALRLRVILDGILIMRDIGMLNAIPQAALGLKSQT